MEDATKFLKLNMTGPTGLPSVDALVAQLRQLVCEGKINNQALLDSLESLRAYYARVGSFQSASGLRSPSAGYRAGLLKDLIEALRQCGR